MEVCYRTGYMGEDAEGRFGDKYLFGLLFSLYYVWYEWWNCFVADDRGRVVGYILGTLDTKRQRRWFICKIGWRILARLCLVSWWRYPNVLKILVHLISQIGRTDSVGVVEEDRISEEYPAHLHIDILEKYQRKGIGSRLMKRFEEHVKKHGVNGIHLETSERNYKAVPFYKKHGYKILRVSNGTLWPDARDVRGLLFAKKLDKREK